MADGEDGEGDGEVAGEDLERPAPARLPELPPLRQHRMEQAHAVARRQVSSLSSLTHLSFALVQSYLFVSYLFVKWQ